MSLRAPSDTSLMLCLLAASIVPGLYAEQVCPPGMAPGKRHVVLTVDSVDRGLGFNKSTSGFGPELRFKLGETVTIDVVNNLANVGTSVHWHGQDLGRDVWADGAQGLTQRSIDPVESLANSASNVFRYRFVAGPAGTGWYHAHDGSQLMAGLRGALIVEDDKANEKSRDNEHVLMIWDQLPENITGSLALSLLEEFGMGIPPEKWKNAAEPATMPGMSSMDHAMHGTMPGMPMPTTSPTGHGEAWHEPDGAEVPSECTEIRAPVGPL